MEGYGGASVFENTVSAAVSAGLTVGTAMSCDDVDTPVDLAHLVRSVHPESHTGRYLKALRKEGLAL